MIDNKKKPKRPVRALLTAAAIAVLLVATVFAADYVVNERNIFFFDTLEALAAKQHEDNPGVAGAYAAPGSAADNADMETVAEYVTRAMENGIYGEATVISDETDDSPDTPWERRTVMSCRYDEYGEIVTEYMSGSAYASGIAVEGLVDWDISYLAETMTPQEGGQILEVSRDAGGDIVMVSAVLGYETAEGKRFNVEFRYDAAARYWQGSEYILSSAYDYTGVYTTGDNVEVLIEEFDGQIWARAVNGTKFVSIYTTGCTVGGIETILENLNLADAVILG